MPARRRNGRKNQDNKDVYQQPTPSTRSPDTESIALPDEESNNNNDIQQAASPDTSSSPSVQDNLSPFDSPAPGRATLPTPPLIDLEELGEELEIESRSQKQDIAEKGKFTHSAEDVSGNVPDMLLDMDAEFEENVIEGLPVAFDEPANGDKSDNVNADALDGPQPYKPPRSPHSSPLQASTPAPTPEPSRAPVSPPRQTKKAKMPSPKSTLHTPTASQTITPLAMPVPAVGVPSPPMVSYPVSFGRFTASDASSTTAGEPPSSNLAKDLNSTDLGMDSTTMEGTIRPAKANGQRRASGRRPPQPAFDPEEDREEDPRDYQKQRKGQRRMSYGGQTYAEGDHRPYIRHDRHGTDHHRSRSGISRAMGSDSVEGSGLLERVREEGDSVVWSRWDMGLAGRRLLFIGYYPLGLQIWDCSELDAVSEVLNLPLEKLLESSSASNDWDFEFAGVIPSSQGGSDEGHRNLIGLLVSPKAEKLSARNKSKGVTSKSSQLILYSLTQHRIVKRVDILGLLAGGGQFSLGAGFLVVSTTLPPALHILSSETFEVIHKIPSPALIPFSHYNPVLTPSSESGSPASSRRHSSWGTSATTTNNEHGFNNPTLAHGFNETHNRYHHHHTYNDNNNNSVLLSSAYLDSPLHHLPPPQPAPVYAVSGRLLAYASSPPPPPGFDRSILGSGIPIPMAIPTLSSGAASLLSTGASTAQAALGSLSEQFNNRGAAGGITQADLGNAAIKVGGGLLSGMKSLGGIAYKGAVSAASAAAASRNSGGGRSSGSGSGMSVSAFANRFFSKSAPAAIVTGQEQGRTLSSGYDEEEGGEVGGEYGSTVSTTATSYGETGWTVTVVDIGSILPSTSTSRSEPEVITKFIASKSQPLAKIWFSQDGNQVLVAPKNGQSAFVYGIRSNPVARIALQREEMKQSEGAADSPSRKSQKRKSSLPLPDSPPSHMYDLRRGRTPGVIESASWSLDGQWSAFGTRNRTIHVFAVNPYGGRSDVRSHLEGMVRNYAEIPSLPTDLYPLVRLRVTKHSDQEIPKAPLTFMFLESSCISESTMPPNLLPTIISPSLLPTHPSVGSHSYGSASSGHTVFSSSPSTRSEPISPPLPGGNRPKNYQDVLLFDPSDGTLSLRRITVAAKMVGTSAGGVSMVTNAAGTISKSLPGMGSVGKLAMSISPISQGKAGASALSQMMDASSELIGKETTIATWNLKRKREWSEVERAFEEPVRKTISREKVTKTNWLSQAELSTFSKSTRVLPRSIYLTHQITFQALGEDYHALIRRYQLDIPGPKIEVRKGVEVSAYPTGTGESFVEGRYRRDASSSFDEPLASAIAVDLDHSPSQPILPMLPNGMAGSKPKTFSSIPIRSLGDGMTESIGRFKREINKVRSPKLIASSDGVSVPLEFDEEDEDFMLKEPDTSPAATKDSGSRDERSVARTITPPTGALDDEDTWVGDNAFGVDDVDAFDHISAVGFLDEEQRTSTPSPAGQASKRGRKGRKKQN